MIQISRIISQKRCKKRWVYWDGIFHCENYNLLLIEILRLYLESKCFSSILENIFFKIFKKSYYLLKNPSKVVPLIGSILWCQFLPNYTRRRAWHIRESNGCYVFSFYRNTRNTFDLFCYLFCLYTCKYNKNSNF